MVKLSKDSDFQEIAATEALLNRAGREWRAKTDVIARGPVELNGNPLPGETAPLVQNRKETR